jgi:magnesium transporter
MKERTRPSAALPTPTKANTNAQPRQVEHAGLVWLDIIGPTAAHITQLRERYNFDALALEDVLSQTQRPKLNTFVQDGYLFAIFQFPALDRDEHIAGPSEVKCFVGRDYIVTLHDGTSRALRRMFTAAASDEHARAQLLGRGSGYLFYRLIDSMVKHSFPLIDTLDNELARTEELMFGPNQRQAVRALTDVRRDVVSFRHMITPNLAVVRALEASNVPFLRLPSGYFGDLADGFETLIDIVNEQYETVNGLQNASQTLAIQQLQENLRLLLIVLLVTLPLLVIAAIFGMNAALPLLAHRLAFPIIVVVMLLITGAVVGFARYRRLI